jgi:hypothetical protein
LWELKISSPRKEEAGLRQSKNKKARWNSFADQEQVKRLVADMWRECSKGAG